MSDLSLTDAEIEFLQLCEGILTFNDPVAAGLEAKGLIVPDPDNNSFRTVPALRAWVLTDLGHQLLSTLP